MAAAACGTAAARVDMEHLHVCLTDVLLPPPSPSPTHVQRSLFGVYIILTSPCLSLSVGNSQSVIIFLFTFFMNV